MLSEGVLRAVSSALCSILGKDYPEVSLLGSRQRPFSSGAVTLKTSNMFDAPLIDPRYLSDKRDLKVLVEGMKLIRRIARLEPLASYLGESVQLNIDTASDEEIVQHIRARSETVYHPACTAKIGQSRRLLTRIAELTSRKQAPSPREESSRPSCRSMASKDSACAMPRCSPI